MTAEIENLYKLPLTDFTSARNALAKTLSGSDKKEVASLVKPSLPMWAVNQLYWHDQPTYNALTDASEKLRAAHKAILSGRKADTRQPDQLHRTTLEKAFSKAIEIADRQGVRLSDAARDTLRQALSALPASEPAGRHTQAPQPAGFSLITGIRPRPVSASPKAPAPATATAKRNPKEVEAARKRVERERKEAEQRARREAAAALKAQERERKQREKREREIRKAEQALREAERRLAELKR